LVKVKNFNYNEGIERLEGKFKGIFMQFIANHAEVEKIGLLGIARMKVSRMFKPFSGRNNISQRV
jgi:hypothetical protein